MINLTEYLHLDTDNMNYYFIPKGFSVYRGDTTFYNNRLNSSDSSNADFSPNTPFFFGTNVEEVEQYGIVFEFKTTQEYKLLAIDDFNTLKILYNNSAAYPDIQQILKKNYGYNVSGITIRDSIAEKDITFSKWLCEKGYSGYAINNMKTEMGVFHQEIMVCHAESIQLVRQITTDPKEIQKYKDKQQMVNMGKSMDMKRKKRVDYDNPRVFNYSDDSDDNDDNDNNNNNSIPMFKYDSPPTTPVKKKTFGGKIMFGRKNNKTRTKIRVKKTTKRTKIRTKRKTRTRVKKIKTRVKKPTRKTKTRTRKT
jgi:hypothetical protein